MNPINLLIRSFYYFRTGYGVYVGTVFGFVGVATQVYYLWPWMKDVIPTFPLFGLILFLVAYPAGAVAGWLHQKWVFCVDQDVLVESNPYSQVKLAPVMVPMWRVLIELGRREGVDVSEMQKILDESV